MHVTNLTTSLADRSVGPVDPSFEPATPSSRNAAREERVVQEGLFRYHARQQKLADRGTAALLALDAPSYACGSPCGRWLIFRDLLFTGRSGS